MFNSPLKFKLIKLSLKKVLLNLIETLHKFYRLIHKPSGRSYHTEFNPPKVEMTDDVSLILSCRT